MSKGRKVTAGAAALLALLLTILSGGPVVRAQKIAADELREEFRQTYPLGAGGRVTLNNINGSVRVTAWERDEVRVEAVKHAYTKARLDEARVEVDAAADSVQIRTRYPEGNLRFERGSRDNPAGVEYTLTVPRGARLESVELINGDLTVEGLAGEVKASCINGRLTARDLAGEAKLSTINGTLEANFARLEEAKTFALNSVNGRVVLTLPSDASATVRASTVHGTISNDLGLPVRRGRYVGADMAGQLGAGGARVKLSSVNGTIEVRRAGDGRTQSPVTNLLPASADEVSEVEVRRRVERELERHPVTVSPGRATGAEGETARAQREMRREMQRAQREVERATRKAALAAREIGRARRPAPRDAAGGVEHDTYTDYPLSEKQERSFRVGAAPRVRVETFDGAVEVEAWDRPEVFVSATLRALDEQSLRAVRFNAGQAGDQVNITADYDRAQRHEGSIRATASLVVRVPRSANLTVKSGDGRLRLKGVNGEIELRTGDGAVDVTDSRGRLRVQTGDGRVRVVNFDGEATAQTGDGRVTLDGRFRQLSARTGDGGIYLSLPEGENLTIQTDAERVYSDGLAVPDDGSTEEQRVRRWRVGGGDASRLYTLRAGGGQIVLRRGGDRGSGTQD